ncbi:hypothetical protein [Calidithermus timidus]|jgi:hypothetical protein|uniref:hypothetical protein n=1 Tax=Calidithermus timidus TaxID=307124 RepID=UPI00037AB508|nr:hypothetical protein [Calidithermus timidus]
MQIYRRTAKPLAVLLGREERLIYSLCQEEISDVVLAQRTNLALDVLEKILASLLELGLIETVVSTKNLPSENLQSEPKTALQERLAATKAKLTEILEAELGTHAKKYLPEIESKKSLAELEEWSYKLVLKLKLTISQKAAATLEARLKSLFS